MRRLLLLWALAGCAHHAPPPPEWQEASGQRSAVLELGSTLVELGREREALVLLQQYRQNHEADPEVDLLQARALISLEQPSEAEALLRARLDSRRLEPTLRAALTRELGLSLFDQGRFDQAEENFRASLELSRDVGTLNNLGFLLVVTQRPAEALPVLEEALRKNPMNTRARNNYGFGLAALGRYDDALAAFKMSNPEPVALANVGLAVERGQEPTAALVWYQRALSLDPTQPVALEGCKRLLTAPQPQEKTP